VRFLFSFVVNIEAVVEICVPDGLTSRAFRVLLPPLRLTVPDDELDRFGDIACKLLSFNTNLHKHSTPQHAVL
jgi:hypothetical protein